ncbi:MAG: hypothetical protein QM488_18550 [Rhizobiaceae bacterium]
MLKIDDNPTFWNTVKFQLGEEEPETFKVKFTVRTFEDIDGIDLTDPETAKTFLKDTICDLDDIEDIDGKAVKYSAELVEKLLKHPHISNAIYRAYMRGAAGAEQGN